MKVSPWTALPAELRDEIYAYVLTEPLGLTYRTGADGVNRICARNSLAIRETILGGRLRAVSRCLYSLSTVHRGVATAAEQLEFNQIQYVSRQCYRETHGLEFRYNNVLFEDSRDVSAGQRCRAFVNKVVKEDYAKCLNLSIRSSGLSFRPPGYGSSPITLAQYFTQHPRAKLRLHHPYWNQRSPGFLLLGLAYAAAIRNHKLLEKLVHEQGPTLDFDLTTIRSMLPKEGLPPNFRLAPWEESLDKPMLCESLRASLFLKGENISVWLNQAENWFSEGL